MNTYHNSFIHTLKEAPNDAEVISHQLMVRSGMIRKVASGVYSILPLGQRVFAKLNQIIREEMAAIGGAECDLPHVIPAEMWKASGRWDQYGKELLRIQDRSDREFCFGPTHEEVITDLVNAYVNSYKQLPVLLYQIQTKFRDEIRPRFGLMRGREFLMKDAYSFHDSKDSLNHCYDDSRQAYSNIFSRCGLSFIEARADSGSIGGDESAEFLVIADSGEDEVLVCESANFAANVEAATCLDVDVNHDVSSIPAYLSVDTPNVRTIDDVMSFFSVDSSKTLKSVLVMANDQLSLLCLRGDHSLNETKVSGLLGGAFRFATEEEVLTHCGCRPGFVGPVNLASDIPTYLDYGLKQCPDYICGGNQNDIHLSSVFIDRDIKKYEWVDLRNAQAGDPCPTDASKVLESQRGIEVGHVFKLGNKYSEAMGAKFAQKDGQLMSYEMGCYGIGVGRTIAAAIEQSHDENGIVWPVALAPFDVVILNLAPKEESLIELVSQLVQLFESKGKDVIVDDRVESPGVKFKDADLIGFPLQVIVGKKTLESHQIEVKHRRTGEKDMVGIEALESIPMMAK
ncbi:proline--tRNA ligase [Candidatus Marinamargulisbacteria bacterium SCGC AG-343-K17]|nr:proline--tRNA ligase [Candidatus Marinamargulisbacteria bacterium SCGC AG-343-K17]